MNLSNGIMLTDMRCLTQKIHNTCRLAYSSHCRQIKTPVYNNRKPSDYLVRLHRQTWWNHNWRPLHWMLSSLKCLSLETVDDIQDTKKQVDTAAALGTQLQLLSRRFAIAMFHVTYCVFLRNVTVGWFSLKVCERLSVMVSFHRLLKCWNNRSTLKKKTSFQNFPPKVFRPNQFAPNGAHLLCTRKSHSTLVQ